MVTPNAVRSNVDVAKQNFQEEVNKKHQLLWGFETEIQNNWYGDDMNALFDNEGDLHNELNSLYSRCDDVVAMVKSALRELETYRRLNNIDEYGRKIESEDPEE